MPLLNSRHSTLAKAEIYEKPKVSIYIPAYNANTINRAIDSCLNQDFKDLEVCVCNDCSTDSTKIF